MLCGGRIIKAVLVFLRVMTQDWTGPCRGESAVWEADWGQDGSGRKGRCAVGAIGAHVRGLDLVSSDRTCRDTWAFCILRLSLPIVLVDSGTNLLVPVLGRIGPEMPWWLFCTRQQQTGWYNRNGSKTKKPIRRNEGDIKVSIETIQPQRWQYQTVNKQRSEGRIEFLLGLP